MKPVEGDSFLNALLTAPRPGADTILAFYDHRVGAICKDARFLLLPLDDHICHRGDGLFESICYRERTIFGLDAHLARLKDGARALSIIPPCSWEEIFERICDVARASGRDDGDLRVFLSRGPGGFGISPEECPTAGLYIVALQTSLPTSDYYKKGLTAFTSAIPPKQEYLARIKNTNYLPNVFMAMEAVRKGMDVAVTFDEHGIMGEAAVANVALVDRSGRLVCPEIQRILPGTTMLAAMEVAARSMTVVQMPIPRAAIDEANEVLLFTSATLCVGITHFDGKPVGCAGHVGMPGPVARDLKDKLWAYMLERGTSL